MHARGFAIVDGDPVGIEFSRGIGRARVERRRLALRHFLNQTIEFGSRSLVETAALLNAEDTDRLEQPARAYAVGICRIFGRFEAHLDMTLSGKVIDFVGLGFMNDPDQVGAICQVAMMKVEARRDLLRIRINILDTPGFERSEEL